MKFNKNISCKSCDYQCDIYHSICEDEKQFSEVKPIHGYYKKKSKHLQTRFAGKPCHLFGKRQCKIVYRGDQQ